MHRDIAAFSLSELRTKFRLGGPIGDYIGLWEGDLFRDILQIYMDMSVKREFSLDLLQDFPLVLNLGDLGKASP